METLDVAALVEFSEARAYGSLVGKVADSPAPHPCRSVAFGSAIAIVAPSLGSTLNMNRVIGLGIRETASEATLDRIADLYGGLGLSYGIEVGPFAQPAELTVWLRRRRLRRSLVTAMQYRSVEPVPTDFGKVSVVRASGAECRRVADICCSVFRMPSVVHGLIAEAGRLDAWRHWLVYLGTTPIAAALSYVADGVAWLGWDATLPEYRGHHAQTALIAQRIDDAAAAGCRHVTTETAPHTVAWQDPSHRNYEKMGFVRAYERSTYVAVHRPQSQPCADR
jgi:GNAT superfamily N-acetyltransferase